MMSYKCGLGLPSFGSVVIFLSVIVSGCAPKNGAIDSTQRYMYKTSGLYKTEMLGDSLVAWTERDARFLVVFDRPNPRLRFYTPDLPGFEPQLATVRFNNLIHRTVWTTPGEWSTVDIPRRPGQDSVIASIHLERTHHVAGPGSRRIGVAIDLDEALIPARHLALNSAVD